MLQICALIKNHLLLHHWLSVSIKQTSESLLFIHLCQFPAAHILHVVSFHPLLITTEASVLVLPEPIKVSCLTADSFRQNHDLLHHWVERWHRSYTNRWGQNGLNLLHQTLHKNTMYQPQTTVYVFFSINILFQDITNWNLFRDAMVLWGNISISAGGSRS